MTSAILTAPGVPAPLDGFDYPAPRFPRYLLQDRTDSVEDLMPLARSHVRRRYGRSALGDVVPGDELLIVTFPHQNEVVFEALKRALLELGVAKVNRPRYSVNTQLNTFTPVGMPTSIVAIEKNVLT